MGVKLPRGYTDGPDHTKVAVSFPNALFLKIKKMAAHDNKRFSEMVSELCVVGLLDLEESDKLEPNIDRPAPI